MRYTVTRYDVSTNDKQVVIDAGDIVVGFDESADELIVLKAHTGR